MTRFIRQQGTPVFNYLDWANRFREELRAHAESVALAHGAEIDFIQRKDFRKEDRIQEMLRHRGDRPEIVTIICKL